jgi:hypothetical protein
MAAAARPLGAKVRLSSIDRCSLREGLEECGRGGAEACTEPIEARLPPSRAVVEEASCRAVIEEGPSLRPHSVLQSSSERAAVRQTVEIKGR